MSATETNGKALNPGALLSSNSGSQRVSQAALSRSRFLRLAAGALLPFVGWRPSAAAAPNPELAQNSGAPGTKDAAAPAAWGPSSSTSSDLSKFTPTSAPPTAFRSIRR